MMATVPESVENLLDAVKQLSPDELAQFTTCLADWQESNGEDGPSESFLVRQTKLDLPMAEAERLRGLAAKSEQRALTDSELLEYRQLAERSERINATRVQALAELARRRSRPITQVKKEIGWQEEQHGE